MKIHFPLDLNSLEIRVATVSFFEPQECYKLRLTGRGELAFEWHWPRFPEPDNNLKVSQETVVALLEEAIEIGFFEMRGRYDEEVVFEVTPDGSLDRIHADVLDLPSTTFEIIWGKHKKSVYAYAGYPKRLDWFLASILEQTGAMEWVGPLDEDDSENGA
jgi:hypothetical protein